MKKLIFVFFAVLALYASPASAQSFKGILTLSIENKYFCTAFEIQEGVALTAAHCIIGLKPKIMLTAPNGETRQAKVRELNEDYDVAILTYKGSFGGVNVLNSVLSGAPITVVFQEKDSSFEYSEARGIVQATAPNALVLTATREEYKFFSGSPVVNDAGEVVGIVIAGAKKDNDLGLKEGQIVATPSKKILEIFPSLRIGENVAAK